jgi:hypothetical protein
MFVNLKTEEDFKAIVNYLSEEFQIDKQSLLESLFDIDKVFDILLFDKLNEEILFSKFTQYDNQYFLGNYYINFSNDFDRMGSVKTRVFMKLEEPKYTGIGIVSRIEELQEERYPIAMELDKLSQMARDKGTYDFDREGIEPDIDRYNEIEEIFKKYGI